MLNKETFKKIVGKVLRSERSKKSPQLMNPARDWGIGLLVGIIIFVATTSWGALTFLYYKNTTITYSGASEEGVALYKDKLVSDAIDIYKSRKIKHQQLLETSSSPTKVADDAEIIEGEEGATASSSSSTPAVRSTDVIKEPQAETDIVGPEAGDQPSNLPTEIPPTATPVI